jgi:adenylate kinase family enzyme
LGCRYVSFGDLKRDEISRCTKIGIEIQRLLSAKLPLPAELGYSVIGHSIGDGLNIISGYPISIEEFNILSSCSLIMGILVLNVDEKSMAQRFGFRRECPECHLPGVVGDICPIHKSAMVQRTDGRSEEFAFRRKLYQQRISPFLALRCVGELSRLTLDTGLLAKDSVASQAERWIGQLLIEKGQAI